MNYKQNKTNAGFGYISLGLQAIIVFLLCVVGVRAQGDNSVQISVQIIPPYPTTLAEWKANPQKTNVILTNTTQSSLKIRLSGKCEKNDGSVKIETKDDYSVAPIFLAPKETKNLSGVQFQLFNSGSVNITGTDVNKIKQTGKLTEGTYKICARALDYDTKAFLSPADPTGCENIVIKSVDVPLLLAPQCSVSVVSSSPQLVNFQWSTPTGAPMNSMYEFQLIELPPNKTANEIFQSSMNYHFLKKGLTLPSFQYGASEPALVVGKKYAWRVRIVDMFNQVDFQNNGYSIPCYFTYEARKIVGGGKEPNNSGNLIGDQNVDDGDGSDTGDCNSLAEIPDSSVAVGPVGSYSFAINDTFTVGKFKVIIDKVTNASSGQLTGAGYIKVPYLRKEIMVSFIGLKLNAQKQVFDGDVDAAQPPNSVLASTLGGAISKLNSISGSTITSLTAQQIDAVCGQATLNLVSGMSFMKTSLPVGLERTIGGQQYIIAIAGMKFTKKVAFMNALAGFDLPDMVSSDGVLRLGGVGIYFHPDGVQSSANNPTRLELLTNIGYSNPDLNKFSFEFVGKSVNTPGTYVEFNCKGFKKMNLVFDVSFPRTTFKPIPDNAQRAVARFKCEFIDKNKWMAKSDPIAWDVVSMPGFQISTSELVYDHSDSLNPTGITFPIADSTYGMATDAKWHGFFMKNATLRLPDKLRTFSNNSPIISINNVLIDKMGLSLYLAATNVVTSNKLSDPAALSLGGWGASIDTFRVELVKSSLKKSKMNGRILVPICREDKPLVYYADLSKSDSGKFIFDMNVKPSDTLESNLWQLKLLIDTTTHITVSNKNVNNNNPNNDMRAEMIMNAELNFPDIVGEAGDFIGVKMHGIKAQGIALRSWAGPDYFDPGTIAFASPDKKVGGFPISITGVKAVSEPTQGGIRMGLRIGVALDLCPQLAGTTTFSVWSKYKFGGSLASSISYDGFNMDTIGIHADIGVAKLDGIVAFYRNDPKYGNGFKGAIKAVFAKTVQVDAIAQFGSITNKPNPVDNFDYWFVDARVAFSQGIPIFSGIGLYGFNGGVWYNMQPKKMDTSMKANASVQPNPTNPSPSFSSSGFDFEPKKNYFGFKAGVVAGTHSSPKGFNADVTLSVGLYKDPKGALALQSIGFQGAGYMMTDVINRPANPPVKVDAKFEINIPDESFVGLMKFDAKFKVVEMSGQVDFYFKKSEGWYVRAGTPENRMTAKIGFVESKAYLMAGTITKALQPANFLQLITNPVSRAKVAALGIPGTTSSMDTSSTDFKFAFGVASTISTGGKKNFLIFYLNAEAGMGLDIQLQHFVGAQCLGQDNTIGIDGWYASGQAFAYLLGEIGIHIDLDVFQGDLPILDITGAAKLAGGVPNPTYFNGQFACKYNLLGGLVSGDFNEKVAMGHQCEILQEGMLSGKVLINEMSPTGNGVDVFSRPQATFAVPVNKELVMSQITSDGVAQRYFKLAVSKVELRNKATNQIVNGNWALSPDSYQLGFTPYDALESSKNYEFYIKLVGQEKKNGVWVQTKKLNGDLVFADSTITFKSGLQPDNIPMSNYNFSYPRINQRFYKSGDKDLQEAPNGERYVQLISGQPNLFTPKPNYTMKLTARFIPTVAGMQPVETSFSYVNVAGKNRLVISNMPTLQPKVVYHVQFVRKDSSTQVKDTLAQTKQLAYLKGQTNAFLSKTSLGNNRVQMLATSHKGEQLLFTYAFRTSKYSTMAAKLESFQHVSNNIVNGSGGSQVITSKFNGDEALESYDVNPTVVHNGAVLNPLITNCEVTNRTAVWYTNFVSKKIYDNILWMSGKDYFNGTLAKNTSPSAQNHTLYYAGIRAALSQSEASGVVNEPAVNHIDIQYNDAVTAYQDYNKMLNQAVSQINFRNMVKQYLADHPKSNKPGVSDFREYDEGDLIPDTDYNKLVGINGTNYIKMQNGNYSIKLNNTTKGFTFVQTKP